MRSSTPSVCTLQLFSQASLPAVSMTCTVHTFDSSHEAIMGALEVKWLVIVVRVIAKPCTVAMVMRNRSRSTFKIVDAIVFAISVLTAPLLQGGGC